MLTPMCTFRRLYLRLATAAELTATNRSPRLIATLTDVRIKMHRWDNASPVLELDTDLRRYRLPVPVANSRT